MISLAPPTTGRAQSFQNFSPSRLRFQQAKSFTPGANFPGPRRPPSPPDATSWTLLGFDFPFDCYPKGCSDDARADNGSIGFCVCNGTLGAIHCNTCCPSIPCDRGYNTISEPSRPRKSLMLVCSTQSSVSSVRLSGAQRVFCVSSCEAGAEGEETSNPYSWLLSPKRKLDTVGQHAQALTHDEGESRAYCVRKGIGSCIAWWNDHDEDARMGRIGGGCGRPNCEGRGAAPAGAETRVRYLPPYRLVTTINPNNHREIRRRRQADGQRSRGPELLSLMSGSTWSDDAEGGQYFAHVVDVRIVAFFFLCRRAHLFPVGPALLQVDPGKAGKRHQSYCPYMLWSAYSAVPWCVWCTLT